MALAKVLVKQKGKQMTNEMTVREIEGEIVLNRNSISAITESEVRQQIDSAKSYPRDTKQSIASALSLAVESPEECFYRLPPRKGSNKSIEGPSIRLAEIMAYTWKNLHCASRVIEVGEKYVVAQGVVWDLENNVRHYAETRRSIWGKYGRYSEDMIVTTANAAAQIAFRNAVFKAVPRPYWNKILHQCKEQTKGPVSALKSNVLKMIAAFEKEKITTEMILTYLNKKSVDEITPDDLVDLRGIYNALVIEQTTNIQDIFGAQTNEIPDAGIKKVKSKKELWGMSTNTTTESVEQEKNENEKETITETPTNESK